MAKRKTLVEQQNTLEKPVNPFGTGEDRVIQDLVNGDIRKASNVEALDMALAIQQIVRGQNSILELVKQNTEEGRKTRAELAELRGRMDKMDKATEAFEKDKEAFITDVLNRAEKLKASGTDKDKMVAQGAATYSSEVQKARANLIVERQQFDQAMERMPKTMVISAGEIIMVNTQGHMEARVVPEEIRIKHRVWRLPPGIPTEVPVLVAQELEKRRLKEAENRELQAALSKNLNGSELETERARISQKYGSSTESLPVPYDR